MGPNVASNREQSSDKCRRANAWDRFCPREQMSASNRTRPRRPGAAAVSTTSTRAPKPSFSLARSKDTRLASATPIPPTKDATTLERPPAQVNLQEHRLALDVVLVQQDPPEGHPRQRPRRRRRPSRHPSETPSPLGRRSPQHLRRLRFRGTQNKAARAPRPPGRKILVSLLLPAQVC